MKVKVYFDEISYRVIPHQVVMETCGHHDDRLRYASVKLICILSIHVEPALHYLSKWCWMTLHSNSKLFQVGIKAGINLYSLREQLLTIPRLVRMHTLYKKVNALSHLKKSATFCIHRNLGECIALTHGGTPCPTADRVSCPVLSKSALHLFFPMWQ